MISRNKRLNLGTRTINYRAKGYILAQWCDKEGNARHIVCIMNVFYTNKRRESCLHNEAYFTATIGPYGYLVHPNPYTISYKRGQPTFYFIDINKHVNT